MLRSWRLVGLSEGLIYLHDNEMVHGDLKGVSFYYYDSPVILIDLPQGEHINRPYWLCTPSRLRLAHNHL